VCCAFNNRSPDNGSACFSPRAHHPSSRASSQARAWRRASPKAIIQAVAASAEVASGWRRGARQDTNRTRKETIAEIMEWSATRGSPLSREQAEAKADQVTKAMRPHRGRFILFTIVAVLWVWFIASIIANGLAH
jgi:hypothetical protein